MRPLVITAQAAQEQTDIADTLLEGVLRGILLAWPIWAALVVIVLVSVSLALWRRIRLARSGIHDIDQLGGEQFERYLELMFRRLGYKVERTRFRGDYGGDLVIFKDGVRTVVQAKRYSKSVGVRAVQEVVAAKANYDCTEAMVVTNNFFTKQAEHLADKNGVELWDRNDLVERLMKTHVRDEVRAEDARASEPAPRPPADVVASVTPERAAPLATVETCSSCSKVLTAGERKYCESNARRFGGRMLCFRHQRTIHPAGQPQRGPRA